MSPRPRQGSRKRARLLVRVLGFASVPQWHVQDPLPVGDLIAREALPQTLMQPAPGPGPGPDGDSIL